MTLTSRSRRLAVLLTLLCVLAVAGREEASAVVVGAVKLRDGADGASANIVVVDLSGLPGRLLGLALPFGRGRTARFEGDFIGEVETLIAAGRSTPRMRSKSTS
jgi:hypothetical protein